MDGMVKNALCMALGLGISASFGGIPDAGHPDYDLSKIPFAAKYKTMGLDFLPDGKMVLVTTDFIGGGEVPKDGNANHKVLLVSNFSGTTAPQVTEIANNWLMPAGVTVVGSKIYVSDRDGQYEILQNSTPADLKQNRKLIVKWPDENKWNFEFQWHQFAFTPRYKQGSFYAPYSGSIRPGGWSNVNQTSARSGAFLKWDLLGNMSNFAGGLRSPNGAGLDESTGDLMVADNQGSWLPSSTLMLMKQGKFYGHSNVSTPTDGKPATVANWAESLPYEPPIAWLPQGTLRNSPSQPLMINSGFFAGDWIVGDVNNPGIVRVAVDKIVSSPANGAALWFSKGFPGGAINRMAYGPDGAIYIGTCATLQTNWPGGSAQDMYRFAPKLNASAFEMKSVKSLAGGLEVEFTSQVDPSTVTAANFTSLKQWQYIRQEVYGGGKQTDQNLSISQVSVSADGKRVYLKIDGLVKDRVVYFKATNVKGAGGKAPWNDEVWFTHNTLSTRAWDPTVGMKPLVRASSLETKVMHRVSGSGRVAVNVEAHGAWKATLVAPNGSEVDAVSGSGSSGVELRAGSSRNGLHLLRVSGRDGEVVRKVIF